VLSRNRQAAQKMGLASFQARFGAGTFELSRLDPAASAQLARLGITAEDLRALADDQGRIRGAGAVNQLFRHIDALDSDGSGASYDRTRPVSVGGPVTSADLTRAGQAEDLLARLFVPYEQPFTLYNDASSALRPETPPREVSLGVNHITQWDSTSCYKACRRMLSRFDAKADRRINSGAESHYMARAENNNGAITGARDDFARGVTYIDRCLEAGRPVIVGLSHSNKDYNLDRITDHFVIIKGRGVDEEGRVYYTYDDPATSGVNREGRFFVDPRSSMLFRPPTFEHPRRVDERGYQVSQVVTYNDAGFTFAEVTGQAQTPVR